MGEVDCNFHQELALKAAWCGLRQSQAGLCRALAWQRVGEAGASLSSPAVWEDVSHCRTEASRLQAGRLTVMLVPEEAGRSEEIQSPRPTCWAVHYMWEVRREEGDLG